MHPALSIIFFTVASGAGFGLIAITGAVAAIGHVPGSRWFALLALGIGLGVVTLGLMSSTLHLRRKSRARFAFSQWRSSWLSREAVLALIAVGVAGAFGLLWIVEDGITTPVRILGAMATILSFATIVATGMIYASLKTIRQWHMTLTVPLFVLAALAGGIAFMSLALALFGVLRPPAIGLAMVLTAAMWGVKLIYWRRIDTAPAVSTAETATGLGHLGAVKMLDPPHTGTSYLLDEMGYRVARKHATKLRLIAILMGGAAPLAFYALALIWYVGPVSWILCVLALAGTLIGALVERWLFFAEATHTVTLYYGAKTA